MEPIRDEDEDYKIKFAIGFRSWFEFIIWVVWGVFELFFIQSAFASYKEFEPRAGIIFTGFAVVSLISAYFMLLIRRDKLL